MAFLNQVQIAALSPLFTISALHALNVRANRPMLDGRGRDEAPYALSLSTKWGNDGERLTVVQRGHVVRLCQDYCPSALVQVQIAAKAAPMPVFGTDLGHGVQRQVHGDNRIGGRVLVIKKPLTGGMILNGNGPEQACIDEVDRFNACPTKLAGGLAPCFLDSDGNAIMMRVANYQNTATCDGFQDKDGMCTVKCLRAEREVGKITYENYRILVKLTEHFNLKDCSPSGHRGMQGGWLGGRFVYTDYAY